MGRKEFGEQRPYFRLRCMKPSYTLNETTDFATHFDVLKKYMIIFKMHFSVDQIGDLYSSNGK